MGKFVSKAGLYPEERDKMLEEQKFQCACCGQHNPEGFSGKPGFSFWHVDENHAVGSIRAILCFRCNQTLAASHESVARLKGLIQYLEKHAI